MILAWASPFNIYFIAITVHENHRVDTFFKILAQLDIAWNYIFGNGCLICIFHAIFYSDPD